MTSTPDATDATRKTTFVTLVLDETGSMQSIKDDVIGGYNAYVKTLRESGQDYLFTLIKFDSNHHDVVHRGVPLSEVPDLTNETYQPGSSTPLIDVCVKAIKATEEKVEAGMQVALVIQTDGQENASTEYTNADLVQLIKEKTSAGWLILFLGAGIDAFDQATKMGIGPQYTLSNTRATSGVACAAAGTQVNAYAKSGLRADAAWTQEQRMSTGGSMPPAGGDDATVPPEPVVPQPAATTSKSAPIVDEIKI